MKKILLLLVCFCLSVESFSQLVYNNDMAVIGIVSPVASLFQGNVSVTVNIRNAGNLQQSNIQVSTQLDQNPLSTTTINGPICPGCNTTVNVGNYNLNPGCHSLNVWVGLDDNISNNSKFLHFNIFGPVTQLETIMPANAPYWSGSVDTTSFTQNSLVQLKGDGSEVGWIKFDITGLPDFNPIAAASLVIHTSSNYNQATFDIKKLNLDPSFAYSGQIFQAIKNTGPVYSFYGNVTAGDSIVIPLTPLMLYYLATNTINDYFVLGFEENSGDSTHSGTLQGWAQGAKKPYIIAALSNSYTHDINVSSIDIDTLQYYNGLCIPKATVQNLGTAYESFTVTMTGSGGYSSAKTVNGLAHYDYVQVVFDTFNIPSGSVCISVESNLASDQNCYNNIADLCWENHPPLGVSGEVNYLNSSFTALTDSTIVSLVPINPPGNVLQDTIGLSGKFSFDSLSPGTYRLVVQCNKAWGGGNASDGLAVLKHFVGMTTLTGLNLQAADVNADGQVTSIDALMILERFIWVITSFPAGDWVSDQPLLVLPSNIYLPVNLKVLCRGDVNGSFVP